MDFLIDLLYNGFYQEGVSYAAWWIPLATTAVTAGINALGQGKEKRRDRRRRDKAEARSEQALGSFTDSLDGLQAYTDGIDTDQSLTELFGPQVQNLTDRVQAGQTSNMVNVFRTLMGGGGDITGQGQNALLGLQSKGQQTISDIVRQFTEMTRRHNLQNTTRKDALLTRLTGMKGDLFGTLEGIRSNEQGRVDRRSTANRQLFMDTIGMGAQMFGALQGQPKTNSTYKPGVY